MPAIARDPLPDSTLLLLAEGYEYISRRCRRHRSVLFETRLLLQPTICMVGADAARVFYDPERFQRAGAAPRRMRKTLVGDGGVQGLDGAQHASRKQMLLSLMTPERLAQLDGLVADAWRERIAAWERRDEVVLFDELADVLCRAVCTWAGVPLDEPARRTDDLLALICSAAAVGLPYLRGRIARRRAERWAGGLVEQVRDGALDAPADTALHVISRHRDPGGRLLDPRTAAVDVLNVLRPTVAVNRYVVFLALALHEHPEWRERLQRHDEDVEPFLHEVRRLSPFFPMQAARVRRDFDWNGARFPRGRRVILDLYGTNRDPRSWDDPEAFSPERFRDREPDPFTFVPQGGGDHAGGHRCAGEWLTVALMRTAVLALTRWMTYEVPHQDLQVKLSRMPTGPRSGFVIRRVTPAR